MIIFPSNWEYSFIRVVHELFKWHWGNDSQNPPNMVWPQLYRVSEYEINRILSNRSVLKDTKSTYIMLKYTVVFLSILSWLVVLVLSINMETCYRLIDNGPLEYREGLWRPAICCTHERKFEVPGKILSRRFKWIKITVFGGKGVKYNPRIYINAYATTFGSIIMKQKPLRRTPSPLPARFVCGKNYVYADEIDKEYMSQGHYPYPWGLPHALWGGL